MTRPTDADPTDDLTQEEADFFAVGLIAYLRDLGAETRRQLAEQEEAQAA